MRSILLACLGCFLICQTAFAQQLIHVQIIGLGHPRGVMATGTDSIKSAAPWSSLKTLEFTWTRKVSELYENPLLPDRDNPLQATYREKVKITISQAGEVTVMGIRLIREKKIDSTWTIHPDDVVKILAERQPKKDDDPWVGTYKAYERFSDGLYRPTDRANKIVINKKDHLYELASPDLEQKSFQFKIDGKKVNGTPRFLRDPDESAIPILESYQDRGTTVLGLHFSFNSLYLIKGDPSKELPVATPILVRLNARLQKNGQPKEEADIKFAKTVTPEIKAKAKAFLAVTDDPMIVNLKLKKVDKDQKKAAASYAIHAARMEEGFLVLRLRTVVPDTDIVLIYNPDAKIIMCAIW